MSLTMEAETTASAGMGTRPISAGAMYKAVLVPMFSKVSVSLPSNPFKSIATLSPIAEEIIIITSLQVSMLREVFRSKRSSSFKLIELKTASTIAPTKIAMLTCSLSFSVMKNGHYRQ